MLRELGHLDFPLRSSPVQYIIQHSVFRLLFVQRHPITTSRQFDDHAGRPKLFSVKAGAPKLREVPKFPKLP